MLNAAVAGDIFASPSAASVLAAIMTVTGEPGCVVIIKNYTGDRLNFGLAIAQARAAGRQVELVIVGDDCALPAVDNLASKRRGLAGTVLVHKVAGAAAASGLPLAEVADEARRAAAAVGTMGLSLTSCTLPGQASLQRIPAGQVEIGLGIHGAWARQARGQSDSACCSCCVRTHAATCPSPAASLLFPSLITAPASLGACPPPPPLPASRLSARAPSPSRSPRPAGEPGAATIALSHVDELVDRLLEQIMNADEGFRFMTLRKGERVCLLINNLGATTLMELSIVARRAISHLEGRFGVQVVRVYCGTFMSSLDMAGVSLSVMQLDELRIARLDAMTRAPCWPSASAVRREKRPPVACVEMLSPQEAHASGRVTDARLVERAIRTACARVRACHEQLNDWDRLVGDGDCGETLNAGACAVLAAIDSLTEAERAAELADAAAVLRLIGNATERMGGSSGALYRIGLTAAAAEAVQCAAEPVECAMWAAAMHAGIAAIAECGGARVGHRCVRRKCAGMPRARALLYACRLT
jgi:dihydroxyacetone kinase